MKRPVLVTLVFSLLVWVSPIIAAPAEKEWTWMVFLNADNNLDSFGVKDQDEMARIGSNDRLNIVTLIDREHGPASLNYIDKGKIVTLEDLGEIDMGDARQLVRFATSTAARFPARHYALIIWNHGSGWNKADDLLKGISYDDSSGNHISTAQLGAAMADIKTALGKNLDLLGMDACLMQMMEVAWAVRTSCDFIVGSEETEPGDGYPYDLILDKLQNGLSPRDLACHIVKSYATFYNQQGSDDSGGWEDIAVSGRVKRTTQSALAGAGIAALQASLDRWAGVIMSGNHAAPITNALAQTESFAYDHHKDLTHLVQLLKAAIKDDAFQAASDDLLQALSAVIIANATTGTPSWPDPEYPDARRQRQALDAFGLAIYFPHRATSFLPEYLELDFAKNSRWDEMVKDYYQKSTLSTILPQVAAGDLSGLREYVRTAGPRNRDLSSALVSRLLFEMFCEGRRDDAVRTSVTRLLRELKSR